MNIDELLDYLDLESNKELKLASEEKNCKYSDIHTLNAVAIHKAYSILKIKYKK